MRLVNEENWKRFVKDLSEKADIKKVMSTGDTEELYHVWYNFIWNELYPIQYLNTYMSKERFKFLMWLNDEHSAFPCRSYNGYRWVKGYRDGRLKVLQITEDITDATPVPDETVNDWLKDYRNLIADKPPVMGSFWHWYACSTAMANACRAFYPEDLRFLLDTVVKELNIRESN